MGSYLLEATRIGHENIEWNQRAIVEELDDVQKSFRESVTQQHRINHYLEGIIQNSKKLIELYKDTDGARKEEIQSMSGQGPNLYSLFYDKLREIKEYHRKFPGLEPEMPEEQIYVLDEDVLPSFTGDEDYGQCVDLHIFFETFVNLKGNQRTDYLTFLKNFFIFNDSMPVKNEDYKQYLISLFDYLVGFLRRSQPLFELDKYLKEIDEEFQKEWNSGNFTGWAKLDKMDVDQNKPPKEEQLPKDKKKDKDEDKKSRRERKKRSKDKQEPKEEENVAKKEGPLFCEICQKSFAKETVYKGHLNGKKHKKAAGKLTGEKENVASKDFQSLKEFYQLEWKINKLVTGILSEQISNTKVYIEKKQSKTWREWQLELEEQEKKLEKKKEKEESSESEDEQIEVKTTIDNYPVGWDGKPIPYWLYKLHGLGVEYKCEICGNASYWGRTNYERHFQEWRHAHGMRCLGIPNTKHFQNITRINDAVALYEKIKHDHLVQEWRPDAEEEFEDKQGNVFNKKTYDDLKRQGLI